MSKTEFSESNFCLEAGHVLLRDLGTTRQTFGGLEDIGLRVD